jgi:hypothetical protein
MNEPPQQLPVPVPWEYIPAEAYQPHTHQQKEMFLKDVSYMCEYGIIFYNPNLLASGLLA